MALGAESTLGGRVICEKVTSSLPFPLLPFKLTLSSAHAAWGEGAGQVPWVLSSKGLTGAGCGGKATQGHLGLQEGRRERAAPPHPLWREKRLGLRGSLGSEQSGDLPSLCGKRLRSGLCMHVRTHHTPPWPVTTSNPETVPRPWEARVSVPWRSE